LFFKKVVELYSKIIPLLRMKRADLLVIPVDPALILEFLPFGAAFAKLGLYCFFGHIKYL
jgi:hypothetical protein